MDKNSINWFGPCNELGYGQASLGYQYALSNFTNINYVNIGDIDQRTRNFVRSLLGFVIDPKPFDPNLPSAGFWHLHDSKKILGRRRAILTTFELDKIPANIIEQVNKFDIIGTASKWGVDVLHKHFPEKKIIHTPHGTSYRFGYTNPISFDRAPLTKDHLVLSSSGKFENRKGHTEILDALEILADRNRNIKYTLLAAWANPFIKDLYPHFEFLARNYRPVELPEVYNLIYKHSYSKKNLNVMLLDWPLPKDDLISILASANAYISASKAEGWDFGLYDLMHVGTPCIATMNTAHLDYCTEENCVPIYTEELEPAVDGTFFNSPDCGWSKVTAADVMSGIMRFRLMSEQEIIKMAEKARKLADQNNWENSAKTLLEALI